MRSILFATIFGLSAVAMAAPAASSSSSLSNSTVPATLSTNKQGAALSATKSAGVAIPITTGKAAQPLIPAAGNRTATATPKTPAAKDSVAPLVAKTVASMGSCPQDCWNEGAAEANCDPNTNDQCLCGAFFDAVTQCVSETCSIGENLEVLNTLETACDGIQ